jgi:tetratricopeptide (TPR) repeat protein
VVIRAGRLAWVVVASVGVAVGAGCGGAQTGARLSLPPEMQPPPPGATGAASGGDRATVRLAEQGRVFEVELPAHHAAYAVAVPVGPGARPSPALPGGVDAESAARAQAYLIGVARVRELYGAGRVELALAALEDLLAKHPDDDRLWAMKGSLHRRTGQRAAAQAAWRRALELSPGDVEVAEALRGLELEGGR